MAAGSKSLQAADHQLSTLNHQLTNGRKSSTRRFPSSYRRPLLGCVLSPLPQSEALGLGKLLAGRRRVQLDHRAVGCCRSCRAQPAHDLAPRSPEKRLLELFFRRALGNRRAELWSDRALPWPCARHLDGTRLLRRVWHAVAHYFSRKNSPSD